MLLCVLLWAEVWDYCSASWVPFATSAPQQGPAEFVLHQWHQGELISRNPPKTPANNPKPQTIPQPSWWGILSSFRQMSTLRRRVLFVRCSWEFGQTVKRFWCFQMPWEEFLSLSCILPPFCTRWFHSIFVSWFRLSAMREGGCWRREQEWSIQEKGPAVCSVKMQDFPWQVTGMGKLYLGLPL